MSLKRQTVDVDHSPTVTSRRISVVAAVIAAALTAPFAILTAPFALGGVTLIAAGLYFFEQRLWVSVGIGSLFAGIIIAGAYGITGEVLVGATVAMMVAWTSGTNAISIGEQIGRQAPTERAELIHAAAALTVGVAAGGAAYVAFSLSVSGRPAPALVLILFGAILLIWEIRR